MFKQTASLKKTGGALAVAAGVLGILATQLMFVLEGMDSTRESQDFATLVVFELGTVVLSFLTAASGAVSMSTRSRIPGALLIIAAIIAAFLGGPLVAFFMAVALAGGVMVLIGDNRLELNTAQGQTPAPSRTS